MQVNHNNEPDYLSSPNNLQQGAQAYYISNCNKNLRKKSTQYNNKQDEVLLIITLRKKKW